MNLEHSVGKAEVGESHLKRNILVLTEKVFDSSENRGKDVFHNIGSHLSCCCNRNRVQENHAESFLVNTFLRFCRGDLFFVVVSLNVILQFFVNDKFGPKNENQIVRETIMFDFFSLT